MLETPLAAPCVPYVKGESWGDVGPEGRAEICMVSLEHSRPGPVGA